MNLQEALTRIKELEYLVASQQQQIEDLASASPGTINPLHRELLEHLIDGPKTISELGGLMTRENRTISQWLHTVKVRLGANIVTLGDGRKSLVNKEVLENLPIKSMKKA